MSEQNKKLVMRMVDEFWNEGRMSTADELLTDDHVIRDPATPGDFIGPDGMKRFASIYRDAFPDLHFTTDQLIAEGDLVAERWRAAGTHTGELPGVPATGRSFVVSGVTIFRFRDGKIAEHAPVWDALGLLRQLGVAPEVAATAS